MNMTMPSTSSVYTHCDELDRLPVKNRENWLTESSLICELLKPNASVLQIGCANASRLIDLQRKRPNLHFLGIDIDEALLSDARRNIAKAEMTIGTKHCDITSREQCEELGHFDYVLCLNNTLGYIPDEKAALANMHLLGKKILISVYTEQFTDSLAREYFGVLGLKIQKIENNRFTFEDFTSVKRYTRKEIQKWGGTMTKTILGSLCTLE